MIALNRNGEMLFRDLLTRQEQQATSEVWRPIRWRDGIPPGLWRWPIAVSAFLRNEGEV
jgi:hypothetical protein